jgi:hypothetical protein
LGHEPKRKPGTAIYLHALVSWEVTVSRAIRCIPVALLVAITAFDCIMGTLELPEVLVYSEAAMAFILIGVVGQIAEAL